MWPKNENKLTSDSDREHDTDHDVESPGYGGAESISAEEKPSDSRKDAESISGNELWREATKRLAAAVLAAAALENGKSGRESEGDGGKSSRSSGSGSARSAGAEGSAGFPDHTFGSAHASVAEAGGDTASEADLLDIVMSQWRLIGAIVGVITIVGAVILSQLTPLYTARAEMIIATQGPTLPALEGILSGIGTDEQSIATEASVLTSGVLLDSVIDRLDLVSDPEFNGILNSSETITDAEKTLDQSSLQAPTDITRALAKLTLFSRLDVAQVGASRVISIHATSEFPDKAAKIANTLVDEYFQFRRDSKIQASSETSAWLEERIADLQAELMESEQRAGRFRSDAELLEAGGTTLISQQLVNLNGQIMLARAATAAARADFSQVSELIRSSDSNSIRASAGVLQSQVVQEQRRQQVLLERAIAELSSELGPAHPRMRQLKADAADLENQISVEVDKVVQGLRNSVKVAEAREADLERQAELLTARLVETKEDEIQQRALDRESAANQQLLETLLARQKALGSPDLMEAGQPDARVISYATPPFGPSFPNFGISMVGIFMVSLIIGFVAAFIVEIRRLGISTLEHLEAVSKLRALGFVPHVASRRQQRGMLVSVLTKSKLPFAQAMNTLNWQMDESMPESAKVILVTSTIPGEGKTTTAIAIARIKAIKGHKTIIVDADMRKPSVHKMLDCQPTFGLKDVIEGRTELANAIFSDKESPLELLAAGRGSADVLGLVDSSAMSSILEELRSQYDYIIVDSPPIAAAPDACILSREADTTILTVRCTTTPANAVKYALRVLRRHGGHITGTLLTMVEPSRSHNRKYGYFGYYGYYGEQAQK